MQRKIPKLRYKGFEGCWKEYKLIDITSLYQPITISKEQMTPNGKYKVFGANGYIGYYDQYNHSKETLAISCRGENCGTINLVEPQSWITGNSMVVVPDEETLTKYLYYTLSKKNIKKYVTGGAQPQLTRDNLKPLVVKIPTTLEVLKIESLLSKIDILINEKEKEIKLLRVNKKYFLKNLSYQQKMESLKFLGHEFENNLCKLKEVGILINGLTYSPNNINGDGILVLRSSNIINNRLSLIDRVYVDKFQYPKYKQIEKNDILICVRNGSKSLIGKNTLINEELFNTTHGAFMSVLRSKNNKFNSILFETYQYQKQVDICLGATINQLTNKDLENFKFNYPNLETQEKIISIISMQSKQISYLNEELANLINIKSFLLKKMLV